MNTKIPMIIAVRGYAVAERDESQDEERKDNENRKKRKALPKPSAWTVAFDTETSTDYTQNLRIGTYQVRKGMTLHEKGVFYDAANLTPADLALLHAHLKALGLVLITKEHFERYVLYRYGYERGGLILGFNLPFDLSRLATSTPTSKGKDMRGGFSLDLVPEKWRPNILVKHLNSRAAFMRFAAHQGPPDARSMRKKFKTQAKIGYFQDVKTLGAALLGRAMKLGKLAELLGTEHQKMDTDEHGGPLTREYIDYAINDTDVTWDCYIKLLEMYESHGLSETPPHRIYSEASLGKAYLRQIWIQPWTKIQSDFPPEVMGTVMSTYFGGRAEVRIRRRKTRVLYCDFRSMYPTVCTLMGLWQFVIATGIDREDATEDTRRLLAEITLVDLQQQATWSSLTTLVQVCPDDDAMPTRARYAEASRTIGLNYLTADFGVWYTLSDCIAAKMLTGKAPRIISAVRFRPRGKQAGLRPIKVGGNGDFLIDPNKEDFYKRVIELRAQVQKEKRRAKAEGRLHDAAVLHSYQQMLKLLANSTSYGIFAEMNVQSYDRPRDVVCYGIDDGEFHTGTKSVEEPGTHFHPLLATLITGAARLMLALAERVAADHGLGWALCDTDSLALARPENMADEDFIDQALAVTGWFDRLSPYDDDDPLFKVEEQNFRLNDGEFVPGAHEPLYAIAISAKRYVLFNLDADGRPIIRKAMAHGLGHLLAPYKDKEAPASIPAPALALGDIGVDRWQYDFWYQIIMAELEGHPDEVDLSPLVNLDRRAASRYSASTPALLHWFDNLNQTVPYAERVKAFNFLLAYQVSKEALYEGIAAGDFDPELMDDGIPAVVAPFDDDTEAAADQAFDRRTGKWVPKKILATYREVLARYHLHSESKFENGDSFDRGLTKRRHVQAVAVEYIGKEANRWEEQFYLGEMPGAQIEYGLSPDGRNGLLRVIRRAVRTFGLTALANKARLSRQQVAAMIAKEAKPHLRTLARLVGAVASLQAEKDEAEASRQARTDALAAEVASRGLTATAAGYALDPSNLRKMLKGERRISLKHLDAFRRQR